jgi:tripartite ATP-independent transporter DctP family solute receptor
VKPLTALGTVNWGHMNREAKKLIASLGLDIDPTTNMGSLPVGLQQLVELSRVLFSGAQIIILDEPTSALSPPEVKQLFAVLRRLRAEGRSIIFISHFLDDVLDISDRVTVFRNGQKVTVQDLATFEQLSAGTVNVHASGFGINANYNSFFAPWLFNDFAHVERVLESPLAQQWNADLVKTRGVSVLMAYPRAPRQMTNSKRAIRTPDDLKGLKLRVPEIPILFNAFKGLGAEPVAMNFGEVYTALQSGTIEGQENPLPTIVGFSLQEVQKFVSLTEHVRAPEFIYVNARWWTGLDPRVRDLLSTLFAEGKKVAAQAIVEQQQTNLAAIRKANAAINEVDQAAFRTRARPVLDKIGPQFLGADTYAAIVRAAT